MNFHSWPVCLVTRNILEIMFADCIIIQLIKMMFILYTSLKEKEAYSLFIV